MTRRRSNCGAPASAFSCPAFSPQAAQARTVKVNRGDSATDQDLWSVGVGSRLSGEVCGDMSRGVNLTEARACPVSVAGQPPSSGRTQNDARERAAWMASFNPLIALFAAG